MLSAALALTIATPKPWTLVAGGDVMFYSINPKQSALTAIAPTFAKADISYVNLEIPLTTATTPTKRKSAAEIKARTQFIFKADPKHIADLAPLKLDFAGLANNHFMDYGPDGMAECMAHLKKQNIAFNGGGQNRAEAERVAVRTLPNGLKVGMVSYLAFIGSKALWKCSPATDKTPGIAVLDLGGNFNDKTRARLKNIVLRAKKECDFLIVALHWGVEKTNKPIPYQVSLGRAFIDAGADVILGAHPHRLQGREIYKRKPILYSMGNLISPLPAASAIYTLTFDGPTFKSWSLRPMRNLGGKALWYPAKQEPTIRKEIEALDKLVPKSLARARS